MTVKRSTPKESPGKALWETPSRSALDVGIPTVPNIQISTKFTFRTMYNIASPFGQSNPPPAVPPFNQGGFSYTNYWKSGDLSTRLPLLAGIEATGDSYFNSSLPQIDSPLGFTADYYPPPDFVSLRHYRNHINQLVYSVVNVAEQSVATSAGGFILRPFIDPSGPLWGLPLGNIDVDSGNYFELSNNIYCPAQSSYAITVKSMIYAQPGDWFIHNFYLSCFTLYAGLSGVTSKWYFNAADTGAKTLLLTMTPPTASDNGLSFITAAPGVTYNPSLLPYGTGWTFTVPAPGGFFSVDVTGISVIPPGATAAEWAWRFYNGIDGVKFWGGPINNGIPGTYYDGDYSGSPIGSNPIWIPNNLYFPMSFSLI